MPELRFVLTRAEKSIVTEDTSPSAYAVACINISPTDSEKDHVLYIHDIELIKTGYIKPNRIHLRSTILCGRAIAVKAHEA